MISGGRVWNPSLSAFERRDLIVENSLIADVFDPDKGTHRLERRLFPADGLLLFPALCDLHTHLREPGQTQKETVATGLEAALRGGFSVVCAMPNTSPVCDNPDSLHLVLTRAQCQPWPVRVIPAAAATVGQQGVATTDMPGLVKAGAAFFTDDGRGIQDVDMARQALIKANQAGSFLMEHCEDERYIQDTVIHPGRVAAELGFRGIPGEAETAMLARDLTLAHETGAHLHAAHLSTGESVRLIRTAKLKGTRATAEVNPHHLILTDEAVRSAGSLAKINPPLRSEGDRAALLEGLRDGTIDCIATDHAPHTAEEKAKPFEEAPCGISGLETAWSALFTYAVEPGLLDWTTLIRCFSATPRRLLGLREIGFVPGASAEFFVFDPSARWEINAEALASRGKNTPFLGGALKGRIIMTFVGGEPYVH